MEDKHNTVSYISILHQAKLVFRSIGFVGLLAIVLYQHLSNTEFLYFDNVGFVIVCFIIWIAYLLEMIARFFPNNMESMGCQKQFKINYMPLEYDEADIIEKRKKDNKSAIIIAILWIALVALIGVLYYFGIIDIDIILLICLFFAICDMICILYYCPFQELIMKNRCCVRCRIYNWDYAMMFLPLIYIPHFFTYSLLAASLALLVKWEVEYNRNPERYEVFSNAALSCENCQEKLCSHKTSLQRFIKKYNKMFQNELSKVKKNLH